MLGHKFPLGYYLLTYISHNITDPIFFIQDENRFIVDIFFLQVMERFNVDIRFPKDKDSSVVVIQGLEENVEDAKEHLITLAEDYVSATEIYSGTSE